MSKARKADVILRIQIAMCHFGATMEEARWLTVGWTQRPLEDLQSDLRALRRVERLMAGKEIH